MRSMFSMLLILLVADVASAGLFRIHGKGCSDGCPSLVCEPVIARPSCTTIYSHQRRICATKCCGEEACGPASCCAPTACLEADCSVPELFCTTEASCCAPEESCCIEPSCAAAAGCCVENGCGSGAACYSSEDCKVIAELIHQSMTGCYSSIRRKAVHRLGDHFDCVCHPEIMTAFIQAMNDSDESVRAKAADEIGDQIRRNRVCIGPPVVKALQGALADCDWAVRREAATALRLAGYRIVDGACCSTTPQNFTPPSSIPQNSTPPSFTPPNFTPQFMAPPQIHPEVLDESDVPTLQLLPEESQLSTQHKSSKSLKVLPVSTRFVSKLKPITDGILRKQTVQAVDTVVPPAIPPAIPSAIPPAIPPAEPAYFVPAVSEEGDVQNGKPRRRLMDRLFGELRN